MIGGYGSLRFRIFTSMMVLTMVSFVLTGTITFYHFRKENEQYHLERLKRKEYAVNSAVDYFLRQDQQSSDPDSLVTLFSDKICELADIHQLDINIYSLRGQLLISSNPQLIEAYQMPDRLPTAMLKRIETNSGSVILESGQDIGKKYLSTFDFITNRSGDPVALINLPYFQGDKSHIEELKRFLRTLSEIYLLLFGAAALLAYFLSNYIAGSLDEIAKKLKSTRLSGRNEPLHWPTKDEIGELVQEYNRMLKVLEDSAVELARNERDHAWRDMARQVAHEIKNPLTPMRLQLQLLERKAGESEPERLRQIARSTIEQIDHLTEIAEAFSRFASLPALRKEPFDLLEVLRSSVELFSQNGAVLETALSTIAVEADKAQWNRVFNNLLKNAVQAIPDDRSPQIIVKAWIDGEMVYLSICDNGVGIPEEQHEQIFEPRFTTKTGGMGLGLAMVKRIVEQSNGQISFQSRSQIGTCFYVSLALSLTKSKNPHNEHRSD